MMFRPNPSSGIPIYLQLMEQVKDALETGAFRPGDQVPGIRPLAEELVISPNAVARAYRELEQAGVVTKRRTAGTYVSDAGSPLARRERLKIVTERIDALLAEAGQLNVGLEEVLQLVRQRADAMQPRPEEK